MPAATTVGVLQLVLEWIYPLLCATWVGTLAAEFALRRRAGAVLLDLGRINPKGSGTLFALAAIMSVVGVVCLRIQPSPFYGLNFILWGVSNFVIAARRLQMREAGMLVQGGFLGIQLIRWQDIDAYELETNGKLLLNLREKGWTKPRKVPFAYVEQLDGFLAPRCHKLHEASR